MLTYIVYGFVYVFHCCPVVVCLIKYLIVTFFPFVLAYLSNGCPVIVCLLIYFILALFLCTAFLFIVALFLFVLAFSNYCCFIVVGFWLILFIVVNFRLVLDYYTAHHGLKYLL